LTGKFSSFPTGSHPKEVARINSNVILENPTHAQWLPIESNHNVERMKTLKSRSIFVPIANMRFRLRRADSLPLSEAIPFWFAISSPLIGLVLGFLGAWFVTWLTS